MSTERKLPKYIDVDGFRLPSAFHPQAFRDIVKYKPRTDDIFLVTYPKCGTNWMHFIIYLIYNKGKPPTSGAEFFSSCPFPEAFGIETIATMRRPGVIKTHLPFHLQPYSPEAKFIVVTRNPKDCCVSFYHHTENTGVIYDFEGGDFSDYFELFMNGENDYGDYYDHTLGWYEHRNDPNVLALTYEEMKRDTAKVIVKVAKFLGEEYGEMLESDDSLVQLIVENSNVKNMKTIANDLVGEMSAHRQNSEENATSAHLLEKFNKPRDSGAPSFRMVRKGIIGDWRNMMSPEQVKRIDEKTEEKMGHTELYKYWKDIGAI